MSTRAECSPISSVIISDQIFIHFWFRMAERGEDYSSDNESDVAFSLGSDVGEDSGDGRYKTD